MDVNEHRILSTITFRQKIKVEEQLVVIKDMDVKEQKALSNITLRHKFRPAVPAA
jgi:hypothetical protein